VKYKREIRPRRTVHGIVMKQHLQPFILITKGGEPESAETDLARAHRFLVETSLTHEQPLVLAYKRGEWIKFYVFDPWQIKKESKLIRIEDYVAVAFSFELGWRWDPPGDLADLWRRMRMSRYRETRLEKFV